jgi:hypothetical protein
MVCTFYTYFSQNNPENIISEDPRKLMADHQAEMGCHVTIPFHGIGVQSMAA